MTTLKSLDTLLQVTNTLITFGILLAIIRINIVGIKQIISNIASGEVGQSWAQILQIALWAGAAVAVPGIVSMLIRSRIGG